MNETKNFKLTGNVIFAGVNNEGKKQISIELSDEQINSLNKMIEDNFDKAFYDSTPIKEMQDGRFAFKSSTIYDVPCINEDKEKDYEVFATMGAGSNVTIFCNMKDVTYKRKHYIVAYLKSFTINNYIEKEDYNPFIDDSILDL